MFVGAAAIATAGEERAGELGVPPIPALARYENDPVGFLVDELGARNLYPNLEAVAESVLENRVTDVPAGHGVGKTWIAGGLAAWWVFGRGGAFVSTAPGHRQVRRLLWKEINRAHDRLVARHGNASGRCDVTQLTVTAWHYGYGFAAPDWNPDAAVGEHHPRLLVIVDEANAIRQPLWESLGSLTTGAENRRLNLANPTAPDTPFFRSCRRPNEPGVHQTIKIPVWDHPNVTEKEELVPGAVTVGWINGVRDEFGEESSYWRSRCDAEFPEETHETLIPRVAFDAALKRYDEDPNRWRPGPETPRVFGVDVGERRDRSAVTTRAGSLLEEISSRKPMADDRDIARLVATLKDFFKRAPKGSRANIDGTGIGAGAASVLIAEEYDVTSVRVGEKAIDADRYKILRDELAGLLRERFLRGTVALRPPQDDRGRRELEALKDELAAIHWERDLHGRFKIEEKKLTRERLGRSPDRADSAMLAFAEFDRGQAAQEEVYEYEEYGGFVL